VHGSGDLTVRGLEAQSVRARLSGPGNMILSGNTTVLSAQVSGSGDLDARQLCTRQTDVTVHGPATHRRARRQNGQPHPPRLPANTASPGLTTVVTTVSK
jgi:hypothetical protein